MSAFLRKSREKAGLLPKRRRGKHNLSHLTVESKKVGAEDFLSLNLDLQKHDDNLLVKQTHFTDLHVEDNMMPDRGQDVNNNKIILNLAQLQNLVKRDPDSYKHEFEKRLTYFDSQLEMYKIQQGSATLPISNRHLDKELEDSIHFLSQTAHLYTINTNNNDEKGENKLGAASKVPSKLINLLTTSSILTACDLTSTECGADLENNNNGNGRFQSLRICICQALNLLMTRSMISSREVITLYFDLLKISDKSLREYLKAQIIRCIKLQYKRETKKKVRGSGKRRVNVKSSVVRLMKNDKLEASFIYKLLTDNADSTPKMTAKISLDILIALFRKKVWCDAKTVNVIANVACNTKLNKLRVTALNFFLNFGSGEGNGGGDVSDDDSDNENENDKSLPSIKSVVVASKVSKKTKKRAKFVETVKKAHKRLEKRKNSNGDDLSSKTVNFSALHLLYDPQETAESLFKVVQGDAKHEKFEVRLAIMDLISRIIGTHQIILLPFYTYISKFLNPHQREVVKLLQFVSQATHSLIPPELIETHVVEQIMKAFVSECNSGEVMAVGLNAIREILIRQPLACSELTVSEICHLKLFKKEKGVQMASKAIVSSLRLIRPDVLPKSERGRPTEATNGSRSEPAYGLSIAKSFLVGAESLKSASLSKNEVSEGGVERDDVDAAAEHETVSRLFDDADFRKLDVLQAKRLVQTFRKGTSNSAKTKEIKSERRKRKRGEREADESLMEGEADFSGNESDADGSFDLENEGENYFNPEKVGELVPLSSIEMVHKKRKHDKDARLKTVQEGRKDREKFGSTRDRRSGNSKTNREKQKKQNFSMIKHKLKAKNKKKTFVQKQMQMQKALINSMSSKKIVK